MAANVNRTIIAGTLGRDPETRFFDNGQAVGKFSLALNRTYKNKQGEKQEETTWVDVECWGRVAELCCQYLTKGRQALVEGRLKTDSWEDKDGNKRSKLLVVAENVQFIGGKSEGRQEQSREPSGPSTPPPAPSGDDGDPPF